MPSWVFRFQANLKAIAISIMDDMTKPPSIQLMLPLSITFITVIRMRYESTHSSDFWRIMEAWIVQMQILSEVCTKQKENNGIFLTRRKFMQAFKPNRSCIHHARNVSDLVSVSFKTVFVTFISTIFYGDMSHNNTVQCHSNLALAFWKWPVESRRLARPLKPS